MPRPAIAEETNTTANRSPKQTTTKKPGTHNDLDLDLSVRTGAWKGRGVAIRCPRGRLQLTGKGRTHTWLKIVFGV